MNTNPVAKNGIEIKTGSKVFRTSQDDYRRNGSYLVEKIEGDLIYLVNLDGSRVNYNLASEDELQVIF